MPKQFDFGLKVFNRIYGFSRIATSHSLTSSSCLANRRGHKKAIFVFGLEISHLPFVAWIYRLKGEEMKIKCRLQKVIQDRLSCWFAPTISPHNSNSRLNQFYRRGNIFRLFYSYYAASIVFFNF